jgi:YegS/Rv2252/BmrU family lipid kinase
MSKKILCAINPYSGKGSSKSMLAALQAALPSYQWVVIASDGPSYFSQYISSFIKPDIDAIAVFGGDGTMHDVVNGLYQSNHLTTPVLLFPAGTGNSFNHDLECLDYQTAIERLKKFELQKIDLLKLTTPEQTLVSFNIIGWGLVAQITALAERLRIFGGARYTIASILKIFANPTTFATLTYADNKESADFSFVLIMNTIHTGKGMMMAPNARLSDGLMDVLIVKKTSLLNLLFLFPSIYAGKHVHSKLLEYKQISAIAISATDGNPLTIDGEVKARAPLSVSVLPLALTIIK